MRSSDFIRQILDIMDQVDAEQQQPEVRAVEIELDMEPEVQEPEYSNQPDAVIVPTSTILSGGTDLQAPKNPSDLRAANSFSMFPAFQAQPKE